MKFEGGRFNQRMLIRFVRNGVEFVSITLEVGDVVIAEALK